MTAALVLPRQFVVPRRSSDAGHPQHPGRAHRRHPVPGRDMRDVPIPRPPGPPPVTKDGTRLVWSPWTKAWQPFSAPCERCDRVRPVRADGMCVPCSDITAVFG